ncbi:transglutaminase-like domain-containing protein [Frateuria terrea]|uniref:Transglutaminase-like enzyme, putative cysteine protease n=1 Tax=Frateuria terrea TaxID=529704 RepID=A0A1H6S7R6_9GAMM|nr:transglutaminase domain-containing protein [Frateuria terrea]SEI60807.1 Transglutaminase-like enzyme, putative cysteine protease [Frateuria terrea]SFP22459.1 Transglutaminase-like enzyme, putative cysteine protease [Frateuria terrea]
MTKVPGKQRKHETSHRRALAGAVLAGLLCCAVPALASLPPSAPPAIVAQIDHGHFDAARAAIAQALAQPGLTPEARQALEFQRERMRRILLDFSLTAEDAKARIRKQIPDLTEAEFARWDDAGLIEHMVIDGRTLYFNRGPSNLFLLSAEARDRRGAPPTSPPNGPNETLNDHHRAALREALQSGKTGVLPMRVRVTQTLTVDPDAVPAGETLKAWIPYPRAIPGQQDDIRLVASQPAGARVAPVDTLQRTAYMEAPARAGQPTVFKLTYEVTLRAQYHRIDPAKVVPATITPELRPFVEQRPPHIVFTDDMRAFSRKVVGDEKNPYRIAQKLFAAVDRIPWAGAREYSTISNIGDYTLHAGHGDCGEQTLLLLTLLRMNGIPARWQSGWMFSDGSYDNIHDWGQVYFAPYGWVPVDVTFGQLEPKPGDDPRLRWFYLGGLDAYRIAFNDDYSRPFVPAKQFPRSETVDSQRGEVEWRGGNLYFDKWDYHFDWQFLHGRDNKK